VDEERDQHVHAAYVLGVGFPEAVVERETSCTSPRARKRDRALSVMGRLDGVGRAQRARGVGGIFRSALREP